MNLRRFLLAIFEQLNQCDTHIRLVPNKGAQEVSDWLEQTQELFNKRMSLVVICMTLLEHLNL